MTTDQKKPYTSGSKFADLKQEKYLSLITLRKSGVAVPTPVWFAAAGETLYIGTDGDSGKVKRLRNNPAVTVAACTSRGKLTGPVIEARGRVVDNPVEQTQAEGVLAKKYGIMRRVFYGMITVSGLVRRRKMNQVYLAIE